MLVYREANSVRYNQLYKNYSVNGLLKELNVFLLICYTKESSRRLVLQLQLILPKKLTVLKAL